jgi:hypothetical protein
VKPVKAKPKKTVFVAFCDACGFSRPIRSFVMKNYIGNPNVPEIACLNNGCDHMTYIPEHIKRLALEGDLE